MKFKVFYSDSTDVKKLKGTLEDFSDAYMEEFKKKSKEKMMGFKVKIEPTRPSLIDEKDGIVVDIKIDIPKWSMFMVKKGDWVKYFKEFLSGRNINFKDIKYIGG